MERVGHHAVLSNPKQTTAIAAARLKNDRVDAERLWKSVTLSVYRFDFDDDWWHQINVDAVEDKAPRGQYPRITNHIGQSPPQYAD